MDLCSCIHCRHVWGHLNDRIRCHCGSVLDERVAICSAERCRRKERKRAGARRPGPAIRGSALEARRVCLSMSKRSLALRSGLTEATVVDILAGGKASQRQLIAIAHALEMGPWWDGDVIKFDPTEAITIIQRQARIQTDRLLFEGQLVLAEMGHTASEEKFEETAMRLELLMIMTHSEWLWDE